MRSILTIVHKELRAYFLACRPHFLGRFLVATLFIFFTVDRFRTEFGRRSALVVATHPPHFPGIDGDDAAVE